MYTRFAIAAEGPARAEPGNRAPPQAPPPASGVLPELAEEVGRDNAELEELAELVALHATMAELRVFFKVSAPSRARVSACSRLTPAALSATRSAVPSAGAMSDAVAVGLRLQCDGDQEVSITMDCPLTTTLARAVRMACDRADTLLRKCGKLPLVEIAASGPTPGPGDPAAKQFERTIPSLVARRRARLRRRDERTGHPGATFGGQDAATLSALGFRGAGAIAHLALELRGPDDPAFVEFDPNAMHVVLVEWEHGSSL